MGCFFFSFTEQQFWEMKIFSGKLGTTTPAKKLTVFLVNFFSPSFTALFAVVVTTTGKYGK
jgi:hypothetical protein